MAFSGAQARAGVDEFRAYLLPEVATGDPGEPVDVTFEVDASAMQFNGYEITLQFDPDVISFDSVAEGPLFTGACGSNFTNVAFTDSTVTYSHVILCGDVSVDGPGVLSTFTFIGEDPGTTALQITSDPDMSFFDDGIFVSPNHPTFPRQVVFIDNTVQIGGPSSVPSFDGESAYRVVFAPNPMRDEASVRVLGTALRDADVLRLDLFDPAGRRVRSWHLDPDAPAAWFDGRDESGRPLPTGVFWYRAETEDGFAGGSVRILR